MQRGGCHTVSTSAAKRLARGTWLGRCLWCGKLLSYTFKFWGFAGPDELYSMPKQRRDEFFDGATEFVESIFGPDGEGLEKLLGTVGQTEDLRELRLHLLKAQDIEREVRTAFVGIADKTKSKAKELDNWISPSRAGSNGNSTISSNDNDNECSKCD